jgi:hypothetical protein
VVRREGAMNNRKAADHFADIRGQFESLKREIEQMRQGFINGDLDPVGDEYEVEVQIKCVEHVSVRMLRKVVPPNVLKPFLVSVPTHIVHSKLLKKVLG